MVIEISFFLNMDSRFLDFFRLGPSAFSVLVPLSYSPTFLLPTRNLLDGLPYSYHL